MNILNKLAVIFLITLILISGCSPKNNVETLEVPKASEEHTANEEKELESANEIQMGKLNQVETEKEITDDTLKTDEKKQEDEAIENNEVDKNIESEIQQTTGDTNSVENNITEEIVSTNNNEKDNIINQEINQEEQDSKTNEEDEGITKDDKDEKQNNDVSFSVEGNVKNEIQLSVKDLKSMDDIIFEADFFALNSFGTKAYFHFKGVKLWNLLEKKAEISEDATSVTIQAEDGYKMVFTLEQVKKQDYIDEQNENMLYPMIIAWEENNVEYDDSEGAPFKLVVGQKEAGDVNKPQWVSNISKIIVE